jgi:proteasome regulatory subunit
MFAIRDERTEIYMADFVAAWEKIQQEADDEGDASRAFA